MTDEEFRIEAAKHDADFMDGEPLDLGNGFSVAFHASDCRYCAWLKRWADTPPDFTERYLKGSWATTKVN